MTDMAIREYLARVRAALGTMPGADDVIAELAAHIEDERVSRGMSDAVLAELLAELGSPDEYGAAMREATLGRAPDLVDDDGTTAQGRICGMPFDFRGPGAGRLMSRVWNPGDPRVWMPRMFGVGWTLNLGAVAVKLGLARPDDFDEDPFAQASAWSIRFSIGVPMVCASALLALVVCSWDALPARVPTHWGVVGAPDGWAPKALALGALLAVGMVPVIVGSASMLRADRPARRRVATAVGLTFTTVLALGIAILTVRDANGVNASGNLMWAVVLLVVILSFMVLFVPARSGLAAEWRRSLVDADVDVTEGSER